MSSALWEYYIRRSCGTSSKWCGRADLRFLRGFSHGLVPATAKRCRGRRRLRNSRGRTPFGFGFSSSNKWMTHGSLRLNPSFWIPYEALADEVNEVFITAPQHLSRDLVPGRRLLPLELITARGAPLGSDE